MPVVTSAPLSGASNLAPPPPPVVNSPSASGQSAQVYDEVSPFWAGAKGFGLGLGQGVVNTVNGLQDMGIGLLNTPALLANGIAKAEEAVGILNGNDPIRMPYIPSPDWSRNLVTYEPGQPGTWSDSHGWSKFAGATGVAAAYEAVSAAGVAANAATAAEDAVVEGEAGEAAEATEASTAEQALKECFPAGTLVATPRGLFPIESIRAGEEVWSYDLTAPLLVPLARCSRPT